jgi:hypothetical protein
MPWKPGETGNPRGQIKEKKFLAALERAIASDDGVKLRRAADKLVDCAANGEGWAIKELADRLDGKPHQSVTTDLNVHRDRRELSDDELHAIASGGRTPVKESGAPKPDSVH